MKKRPVEQAEKRRRERGSVLATSAIGMLSVLLAVGLGIDISRLYLSKAELQNAADAAALAGVSGLNGGTRRALLTRGSCNQHLQQVRIQQDRRADRPRQRFVFAVNLNGPYISQGAAAAAPVNIRFVKVTTPDEPVGMSFAALVLGNEICPPQRPRVFRYRQCALSVAACLRAR